MFVRDPSSGAVINTEDSHYNAILLKRKEAQERDMLKQQISSLQNDIEEIKSLLHQVLIGNNHG